MLIQLVMASARKSNMLFAVAVLLGVVGSAEGALFSTLSKTLTVTASRAGSNSSLAGMALVCFSLLTPQGYMLIIRASLVLSPRSFKIFSFGTRLYEPSMLVVIGELADRNPKEVMISPPELQVDLTVVLFKCVLEMAENLVLLALSLNLELNTL